MRLVTHLHVVPRGLGGVHCLHWGFPGGPERSRRVRTVRASARVGRHEDVHPETSCHTRVSHGFIHFRRRFIVRPYLVRLRRCHRLGACIHVVLLIATVTGRTLADADGSVAAVRVGTRECYNSTPTVLALNGQLTGTNGCRHATESPCRAVVAARLMCAHAVEL